VQKFRTVQFWRLKKKDVGMFAKQTSRGNTMAINHLSLSAMHNCWRSVRLPSGGNAMQEEWQQRGWGQHFKETFGFWRGWVFLGNMSYC